MFVFKLLSYGVIYYIVIDNYYKGLVPCFLIFTCLGLSFPLTKDHPV